MSSETKPAWAAYAKPEEWDRYNELLTVWTNASAERTRIRDRCRRRAWMEKKNDSRS